MRTVHIAFLALLWLAVAVVVGAAHLMGDFSPPMPQIVLGGLTASLILAGCFVLPFRQWAMTVDLRIPVAFHLTRFVGIYFLILYERGELPYVFAVPGGIGDIITATLALGLIAFAPPRGQWRWYYLAWNLFGTIDILGVVGTAALQGTTEPESMRAMTRLPLCLLITFVVPIIIASHILIFARLIRIPPPQNNSKPPNPADY